MFQGAALQTMGSLGWVHEKAAMQIQNLLICIEMLLASLAHFYIFPSHEWQEGYKEAKETEQKHKIQIKDTLALRDFVKDVKLMVTKGWEPKFEGGELTDSSTHGESDLGEAVASTGVASIHASFEQTKKKFRGGNRPY